MAVDVTSVTSKLRVCSAPSGSCRYDFVMATIQAELTLGQISAMRENFDRLTVQLENARETLQKRSSALQAVRDKQATAEKLLSLIEGSVGFGEEKELASRVIEDCRQQSAELEPKLQGQEATVKRLETEIGQIDRSSFERLKEIEGLARNLRGR